MVQFNIQDEVTDFEGAENNRLAATVYRPQQNHISHPPILLMHGGGQTRHSWDGAARMLAARGNIAITVDARGHGDSDWLANENYSFRNYAEDLTTLVLQVKSRFGKDALAPVVVGASMGGISAMIAQSREDKANPLFSAIVLVDITPRMQASGVNKIMGFMSKNMRDGFAEIEDAAEAIASYLPNRQRPKSLGGLSKNLRQQDDGRWYWHWDPAFIDGKHNIASGIYGSAESLVDAARQISVPTLLVRGGKSELVTEEAANEFVALVPQAEYVDVSDAGHMVAGDKNDVFASAVIAFLNAKGLA
ncbi:MAG: alpha/beta fold hydrolase [Rhizobiaceae bacterium]